MEDIQNSFDNRKMPIDQVGVSDLLYPIFVLDRNNERQSTIANLTISVNLPHHFKGTHMSRFIEILNKHRGEMTMRTLPSILLELKNKFEAESSRLVVEFPYFLEKKAPVTGLKALMDYKCRFVGESKNHDNDFILGVSVPISSLCPCSKAISDYGAHNQRGIISIEVKTREDNSSIDDFIWIEELIEIAEKAGSSPVYPLLKRPDERHVTMKAYDNPVFVEDIVRNIAVELMSDQRVVWFYVQVVNQESIHNHSAFARIEWDRNSGKK